MLSYPVTGKQLELTRFCGMFVGSMHRYAMAVVIVSPYPFGTATVPHVLMFLIAHTYRLDAETWSGCAFAGGWALPKVMPITFFTYGFVFGTCEPTTTSCVSP